MKNFTPFRSWVHHVWIENCEERVLYGNGPKLKPQEYFNQFKWWLRREYKFQKEKYESKQRRRTI